MNPNKSIWGNRGFQILFILLAFFLGFFGNWFWQERNKQSDKLHVAQLLRRSVEFEAISAKRTYDSLKNLIGGTPEGEIYPETFRYLHNPSIYYEIRSRIFDLEPEIINAVLDFDYTLQQCQFSRDVFQELLKLAEGDIHNKEVTFWKLYLIGLERLEKSGGKLIRVIDKYYPATRESSRIKVIPTPLIIT